MGRILTRRNGYRDGPVQGIRCQCVVGWQISMERIALDTTAQHEQSHKHGVSPLVQKLCTFHAECPAELPANAAIVGLELERISIGHIAIRCRNVVGDIAD